MSRSSILAAALLLAGLTAFLLLVSGGSILAMGQGVTPPTVEESEVLAHVNVEPGTWIDYEEASFVEAEPLAVR